MMQGELILFSRLQEWDSELRLTNPVTTVSGYFVAIVNLYYSLLIQLEMLT